MTRSRDATRRAEASPRPRALGATLSAAALATAAAGASLVLALQHLGGLHAPGCGAGSACAALASSPWGRLPWLDWPLAYVGVAYFVGVALAVVAGAARQAGALRSVVRVGALVSIALIALMLALGHLCVWCLGVHVANLALWIVIGRASGPAAAENAGRWRPLGLFATGFAACTIGLAALDARERQAVEREAEAQWRASVAEIADPRNGAGAAVPGADAAGAPSDASTHAPAAAPADAPASAAVDERGFTGRYRLGPELAAIRVVMIGDYQCRQCRGLEAQVMRVFEQRDDVSVSFKHFPMSTDCNPRATRNTHPNACWAARAAETAGMLRGSDGFWEMHAWLFERGGGFTRDELRAGLAQMGYDIGMFETVMQSAETLRLVEQDVQEGLELGIYQTPTLYINGVELRGWHARDAVARAIQQLAARNPAPATAAADRPAGAIEKLIGDWRSQPAVEIAPGDDARAIGPADGPVRVVVFGELLHDGFAEADRVVRELVERSEGVRYEVRYFPFDKTCNPVVQVASAYEHGCQAARAAEAARQLGGAPAFRAAVDWLVAHAAEFDPSALDGLAEATGLDVEALARAAAADEVAQAVAADVAAARAIGASRIPSVYVNGRVVPRWKLDERNVLDQILRAAGE